MLWAITAYFNPAGYRRRLENYRTFRARLKVPLITVEASVDGQFELQTGDADILVQRRAPDVLWQKERLLNVALGLLPRECREVAWLDCDVVFERDDWAERAREQLETHSLVQLFSQRCNLHRQATADPSKWDSRMDFFAESVASKIVAGRAAPEDLSDPEAGIVRKTTMGLAWAAGRDSLDDHGLYDACILGTGDRVVLCAAMGKFDYGEAAAAMTARQAEHYRRWAVGFFAAMNGRVGYVDGRVFHLWHGDLRDRRYSARHQGMKRFGFDPFTDIVVDGEGCWRWSSPKTDMHAYVKSYFDSRDEDGRRPAAAAERAPAS